MAVGAVGAVGAAGAAGAAGEVAQVPGIELGPESVVACGLGVDEVALRGQAAQRVGVRGPDGDTAARLGRLGGVPVEDLLQQLRLIGVHLPRQQGIGDI